MSITTLKARIAKLEVNKSNEFFSNPVSIICKYGQEEKAIAEWKEANQKTRPRFLVLNTIINNKADALEAQSKTFRNKCIKAWRQ